MSEVYVYFRLGFEHLIDPNGVDHILFIVALCTGFAWGDWKKLLALVSYFTVGHSITLALATMETVRFSAQFVEILIPVTILVTSSHWLWIRNKSSNSVEQRKESLATLNVLALGFGLIHGLGFSNYLRALLGMEESIVVPLLSFNIGLEISQISVVIVFISVMTLLQKMVRQTASINIALQIAIALSAVYMIVNRMEY